jgi:Tfp pilus assembly protein PilV
MNRRAGVTLIEVLVALFVTALGLLALLTLFPLGALSMAQAIKDDRVAQTAGNAVTTLRALDVFTDGDITGVLGGGATADTPTVVYFDPLGYHSYSGAAQTAVGGVAGVPRSSITTLRNAAVSSRNALIHGWFTSLDDLTFTTDGTQLGVPADDQGQPAATSGGQVVRQGRFSWAALLRRPRSGDPATEVTIIVYSGRSINLTSGLTPATETPYPVAGSGGNVVTVTFAGAVPDIAPGAWVLDNTNQPGHGFFYRVTGVSVHGTAADLELQTTPAVAPTQIVVLDNVAEVLVKGVVSP